MKIDGRTIADAILNSLTQEVSKLKQQGITPNLAVIQVGDDPGSTAYIRQKQKTADKIGAKLILCHQPSAISDQQLQKIIENFNNDPLIHGIIVQRPLPKNLHADHIRLSKDVDGFLPNSPYPVPVAAAVLMILEQLTGPGPVKKQGQAPSIVVIGRGETAGKPIADALIKRGSNVTIVHSQTPKPDDAIRAADIVISCVGKPNVVRRDNVKENVVLVSVGIFRDNEGKLHGDYEEDEIKDIASSYTPTPGGVGPVNVAALMTNLVAAASKLL
ncbi:MAG: bifunctional 5,10-methylenetetrahydrofolate dehydrogenase/5,10-methenyltetrahydrofolate cyclohydrolase [Patescibacteria group bacterium]